MSDNTVFTDNTKKLLKDIASEAIKPRVPLLVRPLISPAVGIAINVVNNQAAKFVPDSIDVYINTAILEGHNGNYDLAAQAIGIAADTLVDIPNVDDVHEKNMFVTIAQAIVQGVSVWIERKKAS